MNKPRRHDRRHWPDFLNARKKPAGDYYSWKHPETGKEYGLGYSYPQAAAQAREANLKLLSEKSTRPTLADRIDGKESVTMAAWLDQFQAILAKRPSKKKGGQGRAAATINRDIHRVAYFKAEFGDVLVDKVTTRMCADFILRLQNEGKDATAYLYRSWLIDCFNEAESAGVIPRGTNPAEITKASMPRTTRNRLTVEHFDKLLAESDGWLTVAIQLALVTGQRVGDVAKMRYADIEQGFLKVQQEKTGQRIKIPLSLSVHGVTLGAVIKRSRNIVGATTIVHQVKTTGISKVGGCLGKKTISGAFSKLVGETLSDKWNGAPPTFHEIRALSKKLHTQNGVDTLQLLGHDSAKTAKIYSDPREGWVEVSTGKAA